MVEGLIVPSFLGDFAPAFAAFGDHFPQVLYTGSVCWSSKAHAHNRNWHRLVLRCQ